MTWTYIVGDTREVLPTVEPASINLLLTSPPFLGLRTYTTGDEREIGMEGSPGEFIQTMLEVVALAAPALTADGSIAVELGDTFSGSGGAGGDYNEGGSRAGQPKFKARRDQGDRRKVGDAAPGGHHLGGEGWPEGKSLCFIPQLFGASLAYGFNLLTGEPSPAGRWRVRNWICWARTNPTPGSVADKVRVGTSYITVACRNRTRYWDPEAVSVPKAESPGNRYKRTVSTTDTKRRPNGSQAVSTDNRITADYDPTESDTTPMLDWVIESDDGEFTWVIPNQGPPKSPIAASEHDHFATWPEELARRLIMAMCPPSGIVLDPFVGSGTTLAAALGVGRNAIGIDLDERNAELAAEQVGMFLHVDHHQPGRLSLPKGTS
jgi:DNA modification methylase